MHQTLSQWWNGISLRTKITGVTVLLLTTALLAVGLGTMSVMRNYLVGEVDRQITDVASALPTRFRVSDIGGGGPGSPTDYFVAALDSQGAVVETNAKWKATQDPPVVNQLTLAFTSSHAGEPMTVRNSTNSSEWRVVTTLVPSAVSSEFYTLVVGLPLDNTNKAVARMFTIFFLFGIVVVVLGAALTRLLVTSTFGPLRQVEKTAAAIADGDFSQRLEGGTPNTEVGRLNRSLNTMLNRIDRAFADRAKTIDQMRRFVGDASHELRTPLVSVRGYAELYRMGALQSPEEVAQAMGRIEKEAIRMGGLVEDLLELARLDETKPLQLTPVSLLPIAEDAALDAMAFRPDRTVTVLTPTATLEPPTEVPGVGTPATELLRPDSAPGANRLGRKPRPEPSENGGTAATGPVGRLARLRRRPRGTPGPLDVVAPVAREETGAPVPAVVLAEENKLRQVVTNLVANAVRFTPDGSPLELAVYTDRESQQAVLEVIDHGEGIPPQVRDKIFQRFWRADSSRTRDTGGSGLGLAIVSAIVAAHRGTVTVTETPGGGATFRVALPLFTDGEAPLPRADL